MAEQSGAAGTTPAESAPPIAGAADVNALAATLSAERPDVQPHVISAAKAEAASGNKTDKQGNSFDPAIHVAGPDGKGRINSRGLWEAKRGKKPGSPGNGKGPAAPASTATSRVGTNEPPPPTKEQLARISGAGAANLFLVVAIIVGGDEWKPALDPKIGLDEKAMLEGVFGDYFVATGKTDLPPGWALFAGIGMYAAKRFTMPKTQSRIQRAKSWVAGKILAFRMRKRKSTVQAYEPMDGEKDPRDTRVWSGAGNGDRSPSTP